LSVKKEAKGEIKLHECIKADIVFAFIVVEMLLLKLLAWKEDDGTGV